MALSRADLKSYDHIIVAFSGGKDSLACILGLLEAGAPEERTELWHHDVDHGGPSFMDWPVTPDYCRAVAKHLHLPIYFSWRMGGFHDEMMRKNAVPADVQYETPDGLQTTLTTRAEPGTRLLFPMVANDMNRRWCSSYLKIDVGRKAVASQERFKNRRILFVTGERAQESDNRATYCDFEVAEKMDARIKFGRHVDAYRPVHKWKHEDIWAIMERFQINPHPCYKLGWGRCSCACCIFGDADQWASLAIVCPEKVKRTAFLEHKFGRAIHYRKRSTAKIGPATYENIYITDFLKRGEPFPGMDPKDIECANSKVYIQRVSRPNWELPPGAKASQAGPT
jgi:3'-phosphoadenosine 5'-phosphosulfate sulfotransferase (PAPS reductase)/FAD synthetase